MEMSVPMRVPREIEIIVISGNFGEESTGFSDGSETMNWNLRPTICPSGGGFAGSKQYFLKHFEQMSDRGVIGSVLSRARSMAAHWRQLPYVGSAPS